MSKKNIPLYFNNSPDNSQDTKSDNKDKKNKKDKNDKNYKKGTSKNYDELNMKSGNGNNTTNSNEIVSVNGIKCVGPCYPPNTFYYNPLTLTPIKVSNLPSCPTRNYEGINNGEKTKLYYDICYPEDVNKDYTSFSLFDDVFKIANTPNNFLKQIYSINDITDLVNFLSNSFETLPIYSQKRLGKVIFEVYWKYIEFPKSLFVKNLVNILHKVYGIPLNQLSDEKKTIKILDKISNDSLDLYDYLLEKFQ
jgi:hypothetical protein